jgi:acyl-coenzyme A thioesterase PaaI-like protein
MEAGTGFSPVEFKINLLAPGRGERLVAEGRVVRPGRTLTVSQASVYAERDGRREAVALSPPP